MYLVIVAFVVLISRYLAVKMWHFQHCLFAVNLVQSLFYHEVVLIQWQPHQERWFLQQFEIKPATRMVKL